MTSHTKSFQRTPDRAERKAPQVGDWSRATASRVPGVGCPGVKATFRAAAPLPVVGWLLSGRLPLPGREDARRLLSVLHFSSLLSPVSPPPGPGRCPRSLYTSPEWALDVNFPGSVTSNSPVHRKGGHGAQEGGFQVGAERKGRRARKGGWFSALRGWN